MNYRENQYYPQGTCIYREVVTSRYKNRPFAVDAGFSDFGDGLGTSYSHLPLPIVDQINY
jgi:hypothetical protein